MDKKRIYCQGSVLTAQYFKLLKDIGICDFGKDNYWTNSLYYFGYDNREKNNHITYDDGEQFFIKLGYEKVSPSIFYTMWMYDTKLECSCIGGDDLEKAIKKLAETYNFNSRCFGVNQISYSFFVDTNGNWEFKENKEVKLIKSLEEFIDYWKQILPKREIKEKYIGFIGNSQIEFKELPSYIVNPHCYKGTGTNTVYFLKDNVIDSVLTNYVPDTINVVSWEEFLRICWHRASKLGLEIEAALYDKYNKGELFTPNDPLTPIITYELEENKFSLSQKKSLKIVL